MPIRFSPVLPVLALLLLLLALPAARAQTELTLTTPWPAQSRWQGELADAATTLAARTDGRVKLTFTDDPAAAADGGLYMGGALTQRVPQAQVLYLPLRPAAADLDARLETAAAEHGFALIGVAHLGHMTFLSTRPVRTLADLQRTTLWVPGDLAAMEPVLTAFGITKRKSLPEKEVKDALGAGTVDTVLASPSLATLYQWHTRLTHAVDLPLIESAGLLLIRTDALAAVSAADRALLRQVLAEQLDKTSAALRDYDAQRKARMVRRQFVYETPSAAERDQWQAAADAATQAQVDAGVVPADWLQH